MASRVRLWSWLLGAFGLSLAFTVQPFRYGDEWWHIALGHLILAHGIPAHEPFSIITPQHPWVEQQWLYEIVLARIDDIFGAGGASVLMGLAGSLAMLIAVLAVGRDVVTGGAWRAAALVLGAAIAAPELGVRGEVISVLGFACVLLVLSRWHDGRSRAVWFLPPLFLLWANLHAGFVAGLALLVFTLMTTTPAKRPPATRVLAIAAGAAAIIAVVGGLLAGMAVAVVLFWLLGAGTPARGSRRSLVIATVVSLLITLVNPAGPGLWGYIADTFSNPILASNVSEWRSPDFHDNFNRLILAAALLLGVLWTLSPRRRTDAVLLGTGVFALSLQAIRNAALLGVVTAAQLTEHGPAAWSARMRGTRLRLRPLPAPLAAAVAVVVAALSLTTVAEGVSGTAALDYENQTRPAAAVLYAASHHPGAPLFSTDGDAGYIAYRLPGQRVVFVYDEEGIFGDAVLTDYLDIVNLQTDDWYKRLTGHGLSAAVLPSQAAITSALLEKGWTVECMQRQGTSESGWVVLAAGGPAPSTAPPDLGAAPSC